jgi:hypothetical protein
MMALGDLLANQDDLAAAIEIYRRAFASGHPEVAPRVVLSLAELLKDLGGIDAAKDA